MTIEQFKELTLDQKLIQLKYEGEFIGSYERTSEENGKKQPGDIFKLGDFWVFLSDDEKTVIPTRRDVFTAS
jgi:hypothetical protein